MYRAAALAFQKSGLTTDSPDAERLIAGMGIDVSDEGGETRVRLDGEDVTATIRTPEVSAFVSDVARDQRVRERLVSEQRRMAAESISTGTGVVLDGRDIGTYVFPNADLKIYIIADPRIRAARRLNELRSQGQRLEHEDVLSDLLRRDEIDSTRTLAPLRKAPDAIEIDTTELTVDEQVDLVEKIARERRRSDSV